MVLDISLDHLEQEEVEAILKVLERDAKIQEREDTRRRKLQDSASRERIPERRLSVKIRTGEWMKEMTVPGRMKKRRGTEIVRASIRRKERKTPKVIVQNGQVESLGDAAPEIKIDEEPQATEQKYTQQKSPSRRTSVRRKKMSRTSDKQVKFDTDKAREFVYEQTPVDSPSKSDKSMMVPTIVVHEDNDVPDVDDKNVAQPVEVTVITEDASQAADDVKKYDAEVFSSNTTFESYHNFVGKDLHRENKGNGEKVDEIPDAAEKTEASKATKKIRVVKRKGSSRRKMGKITDDSSRDTLFHSTEDDKSQKDIEEKVSETVAVLQKDEDSKITREAEMAVEAALVSAVMEMEKNDEKDSKLREELENIATPSPNAKEPAKIEDPGLISDVLSEVSKEYEKLVEQERHNVTGYSDSPNLDYNHRDGGNIFGHREKSPDIDDKVPAEDLRLSPQPALDLSFDDVLSKFSSKNESETRSEKESKEGSVEASGTKEVLVTLQPDVVSNVGSDLSKGNVADVLHDATEMVVDIVKSVAEIPPQEVENLVESVLEAATNSPVHAKEDVTEKEHPDDDVKSADDILVDEEAENKPMKKIVKKVVKKKKKEEEHQGSPKLEPTEENEGNAEESPENSKLQRKKTVRRKVIRKPPPPKD